MGFWLVLVKLPPMPRQQLDYEKSCGTRDSAWSVVGFAIALAIGLFSAWSWWNVWQSARSGASSISIGVTPLYYVLAAAVAAACVFGMTRGRRRFGLVGLVVTVASVGAIVVLVKGSPWIGARPGSAAGMGGRSANAAR